MGICFLDCFSLQDSVGESSLTDFKMLLFLSWAGLKVISPLPLGDGDMVFNSIQHKDSLAQGGSIISFMVCNLIKVLEDMEALNFFERFHLSYDFSMVVGQFHTIRGLLHIESLNDDSGNANDSQLFNG